LEAYRKSHTDDPSPRFLLAYHYLTAGHKDAAISQLQNLVQMTPNDPLAKQLLLELDPDADVPDPPKEQLPPKPSVKVEASQLYGTWTAERGDGQFAMALKENGDFEWKYTEAGQSQEVTGVWSVDEEGVLAMEMNDGGTMLAQLNPTSADKLDFYMVGDTQNAEPLHFSK
jgi:DICT domain-containing protein